VGRKNEFFVALEVCTSLSSSCRTDASNYGGDLDEGGIPDVLCWCGYSPIAIIAVLMLNSIIVCNVSLPPGSNLVGRSSALMGALCHVASMQHTEDDGLSLRKLRWGVVNMRSEGVGHFVCSSGSMGL
jgi:hypothetical protein